MKEFNIKIIDNKIVSIKGKLIEKYGIKIIIHQSLESLKITTNKHRCYNITEYYTGMTIYSGVGTIKESVERFEKIFNDDDITDLGKKDKLNHFAEMIDENTKKYGFANK